MTEPEKRSTEDRLAEVETQLQNLQGELAETKAELQNLAEVVVEFQQKTGKALDRRIVLSTLPPEMEVRPGTAAQPSMRVVDSRRMHSAEASSGKAINRTHSRGKR